VSLSRRGDWAVLAVTDRDMGIAREHHERIFEQFERAEGAQQAPGRGLGLFVARQIARAYGARNELRSAPGEGSTFTIFLPLVARAQPGEAAEGAAAGAPPGILLVPSGRRARPWFTPVYMRSSL